MVQEKSHAPESGCRPRAREIGACSFEQPPIAHARGAHRLARPAAQTEVYVVRERAGGHRQAPFGGGAHEIEASSWRVVLIAELQVRGTRAHAQPAMDARQELLRLMIERTTESCPHRRLLVHKLATNRPGLKMRFGSKVCLSARMSGRLDPASPHTSTFCLIAGGACSTITCPRRDSHAVRR